MASIFSDALQMLKANAGAADDRNNVFVPYIKYMHTAVTFLCTALTALAVLPDRHDEPEDPEPQNSDSNTDVAAPATNPTPEFFDSTSDSGESDSDEPDTETSCSEDDDDDDEDAVSTNNGYAFYPTVSTTITRTLNGDTVATTTITTSHPAMVVFSNHTTDEEDVSTFPSVVASGRYDATTSRLYIPPNGILDLTAMSDKFATVCETIVQAVEATAGASLSAASNDGPAPSEPVPVDATTPSVSSQHSPSRDNTSEEEDLLTFAVSSPQHLPEPPIFSL